MSINLLDYGKHDPEGFFLTFFKSFFQLLGYTRTSVHIDNSTKSIEIHLSKSSNSGHGFFCTHDELIQSVFSVIQIQWSYSCSIVFEESDNYYSLLDASPSLIHKIAFFERCALSGESVMIYGPVGSGKTYLAEMLHGLSRRPGKCVFIDLNSIPENLIELELFGAVKGSFTDSSMDKPGRLALAEKGTVVIESIDTTPLHIQAKIIEFSKQQRFFSLGSDNPTIINCRIICTSSLQPDQIISTGAMLESLYYELSTVMIELKPLLERPEDMEFFFSRSLQVNQEYLPSFTEFQSVYGNHAWSGNITEYCAKVRNFHFSRSNEPSRPVALKKMLDDYKRTLICDILRQNNGNQTKTASKLGLQRTYLAKLIHDYQITSSEQLGERNGSSRNKES